MISPRIPFQPTAYIRYPICPAGQFKGNFCDSLIRFLHQPQIALSAGAVEYTDCFAAEGENLPSEYPVYDAKQSDGEVPVMLELWGMRSCSSLPSLPRPLWLGVVAPDKGPIYESNRTKLHSYTKLKFEMEQFLTLKLYSG